MADKIKTNLGERVFIHLDNNKYTIALSKQALKDLSHISEPYKSNIENKLLSSKKVETQKLKN